MPHRRGPASSSATAQRSSATTSDVLGISVRWRPRSPTLPRCRYLDRPAGGTCTCWPMVSINASGDLKGDRVQCGLAVLGTPPLASAASAQAAGEVDIGGAAHGTPRAARCCRSPKPDDRRPLEQISPVVDDPFGGAQLVGGLRQSMARQVQRPQVPGRALRPRLASLGRSARRLPGNGRSA